MLYKVVNVKGGIMKIKVFQFILAGLLTLSLSACGADNRPVKETDTMTADQNITLEVLNPKVEISTRVRADGKRIREGKSEC